MIKPERFSSLRVQRYYIFFILQIIKRKNILLLKNYVREKAKTYIRIYVNRKHSDELDAVLTA